MESWWFFVLVMTILNICSLPNCLADREAKVYSDFAKTGSFFTVLALVIWGVVLLWG